MSRAFRLGYQIGVVMGTLANGAAAMPSGHLELHERLITNHEPPTGRSREPSGAWTVMNRASTGRRTHAQSSGQ